MQIWIALAVLTGALSIGFLALGSRIALRIARITLKRNPHLFKVSVDGMRAWDAASLLLRQQAELERCAAEDPETRLMLRQRRICFAISGILSLPPLMFVALLLERAFE